MNSVDSSTSVGFSIKCLDHVINHAMENFCAKNDVDDIAVSHSMVLHYLSCRKDTPTYQRDLEKAFHLTRSAITNIVQILEREQYISRESVPGDARLKRIILQERGIAFEEKMKHSIGELDAVLNRTLSQQERSLFLSACEKLTAALGPYAENPPHRSQHRS